MPRELPVDSLQQAGRGGDSKVTPPQNMRDKVHAGYRQFGPHTMTWVLLLPPCCPSTTNYSEVHPLPVHSAG